MLLTPVLVILTAKLVVRAIDIYCDRTHTRVLEADRLSRTMGQPKTKSSGFRDKFSKWMKPKDNARVPAVSPVATEDIPQRPFNGSATASEVVDANDLQNNQ